MLIKEVFTSVLEILKDEIGSVNSYDQFTQIINGLPPREFDSRIAVKIAHGLAQAIHCDSTLQSSDDHKQFAENLGRVLARLANIHARNCDDCDPPNAAFNYIGYLLNQYVTQDVSGGAPINPPSGGSFIIIKMGHPTQPDDTPSSSEDLMERVRNWDVTDKIK